MKKIAFSGIVGNSRYPYTGQLGFSDGMPVSAGSGIRDVLQRFDYIENKGNMIHGEAPARLFECDRKNSCHVNLVSLYQYGWSPERINDELKNFDLIVFSMANLIRKGFDVDKRFLDVMEAISLDFIVLGVGLQESLEANRSLLGANTARLLEIFDCRSALFGVRDLKTEKWLRDAGYVNALAVGCPSLFVYPGNILNMNPPELQKPNIITGGYIAGRTSRSDLLMNLFKGERVHYIMQQELFELQKYIPENIGIFDDATGEVSKNVMDMILYRLHGRAMPFTSYRWFHDPSAWRAFAGQCDLYVGDRFHGGVAAMQAGRPALIVNGDLRVEEMCGFFNIPTVKLKDLTNKNALDLAADYLTSKSLMQFKETFQVRFLYFKKAIEHCGLKLAVSTHNNTDVTDSLEKAILSIPRPHWIRRIIVKSKVLRSITMNYLGRQ